MENLFLEASFLKHLQHLPTLLQLLLQSPHSQLRILLNQLQHLSPNLRLHHNRQHHNRQLLNKLHPRKLHLNKVHLIRGIQSK